MGGFSTACPDCGKQFGSRGALADHIDGKHGYQAALNSKPPKMASPRVRNPSSKVRSNDMEGFIKAIVHADKTASSAVAKGNEA